MSKYTQKQIELFKRIDPNWEEGANDRFWFICEQIEPKHPFNYCRCQCTACGKFATVNRYDNYWTEWNYYDCYPHYNEACCETPYCCYFYKNSETKNTVTYKKETNYVRSNGQKPIHTNRKRNKTVWKKTLLNIFLRNK